MPYSPNAHTYPAAAALAVLGILKTYLRDLSARLHPKLAVPHADLHGKLVIVTGANSGIGFEAARNLAGMGARVVLACRNEAKGEEAKKRIIESTGNTNVEMEVLDCASFASVHAFLERWEKREMKKIDILLNNAGCSMSTVALTEDGFEQTYQSNHLAHVLLTHSLLNRGHFSPHGRIVSVSSIASYHSDILDEQKAHGHDILAKFDHQVGAKLTATEMMQLYARSKASQVIWTIALQRRLAESEGWKDITVHSCHPGVVRSAIWTQPAGGGSVVSWDADLAKFLVNIFGISTEEGAVMPVWLAVAPEPTSPEFRGMYWERMGWKWVNPWLLEVDRQNQLWDLWCKDAEAPLR